MNKLKYIILICASMFFWSSQSFAITTINKDSLLQCVKHLPDSTRLLLLNKWAYNHIQEPKRQCKDYAEVLLQEATRIGNSYYISNSCELLAYYYQEKPDSMRYYIKKAGPLLLAEGRYEDIFRIKSWEIFLLINENKNEDVLNETNQMKRLAIKLKYPAGELFADIALARFYIQNGIQEEGVKILEQVVSKMDEKKLPTIRRIYPLLILLRYSSDITAQHYFLRLLHDYIKVCQSEKNLTTVEFNSMDKVIVRYYIYSAILACDEKNPKSMNNYIQLAKQYIQKNHITNDDAILLYADFMYAYLTGDYQKALTLGDKVYAAYKDQKDNTNVVIYILNAKSDIYEQMNQYDKALACYEQYMDLKDSTEAKTFYNELNTLHQQRKIDELQTQNQKMKLGASKNQLLNTELKGGLAILFLVFVMLLVLFKVRRSDSIRSLEAQKQAEKASEMKTTFLANINHEIRTPLNAIVGFSQVLVEDVDSEQREQFTSIIRHNNILLQQLISDVLDFSKIESNKMKVSYSDVELSPLMQEIYSNKAIVVPNAVTLKLEQSENVTLYIDRIRLIQIMDNLLDNAIKHTQKGYIHFGYRTTENDVYFFVSDTGEGIPEDKLDTIFGRFTQLSKWSKGIGLGLAICKGLVTQFGGKIGVSSTVGKGSLFWFTIPIKTNTNC